MSKKSFGAGTLLAPVPAVMVSCGTHDNSNIFTVAWTGIICSDPAMTYISVRHERHSYNLIRENGEFVINLPSADLVRFTDLCGVISGKKTDKFKYCGLTKEKAEFVSAPLIAECPVNIECKVQTIMPLGTHDMFLADILNINVDTKLVDNSGKIMFDKADLFAYSHGEYFKLGEKIGKFGFSVKKK